MQTTVSLETVQERHPELSQALIDDMERKLKKAMVPMPDLADYEWAYDWSVAINSASMQDLLSGTVQASQKPEPLDNCHVGLSLTHGKLVSFDALTKDDHGRTARTPRANMPPEIVDYYLAASRNGEVTLADYPHIAQFNLLKPKGIEICLATGGYRSSKGTRIHFVAVGDKLRPTGRAFEVLLDLDPTEDVAIWAGGLVPKARERYDATPEGGIFTYRQAKFTRLTQREVKYLIGGKTLKLEFP